MKIVVNNSGIKFANYEPLKHPFSETLSSRLTFISLGTVHLSATKTTRFYLKSNALLSGTEVYVEVDYGNKSHASASLTPAQVYEGVTFSAIMDEPSYDFEVELKIVSASWDSSDVGTVITGYWQELDS